MAAIQYIQEGRTWFELQQKVLTKHQNGEKSDLSDFECVRVLYEYYGNW